MQNHKEEDNEWPLPDKLDIDQIIQDHIGPIGLWQIIILMSTYLPFPPVIFLGVLLSTKPEHRCQVEEMHENTLKSMNFTQAATVVGPWWSLDSLGPSDKDPWKNKYGCYRYTDLENHSSPLETCKNGYIFNEDPNQYPETLAMTWNLVCDRSWLIPFNTTLYMLGMMIGFIGGGVIGGVYGRRKSIILTSLLFMVSTNLTTISPNYSVYTFLRGIVALSLTAKATSSAVLIAELTLPNYRSLFISIANLFTGCLLKFVLVLLAYLIPSWRILSACFMSISFIAIFSIVLVPESPKWLLSQKRPREALMVLYRGYRINRLLCGQTESKRKASEAFFDRELAKYKRYMAKASIKRRVLAKMGIFPSWSFDEEKEVKTRPRIYKIMLVGISKTFRTKALARKTFLCIFLFGNQIALTFGLTFYARVIKDSILLVILYNASMMIPSQLLNFLLYRCFKSRKKPLLGLYFLTFLSLASLSCYIMYFKPKSALVTIIVCNIVLIFMQAGLAMMYVLITEIFSAELRTQGLGNSSGFGRIGGLICDFINELDFIVMNGFALMTYSCIILVQMIFLGLFFKDTSVEAENTSTNIIETSQKPSIINGQATLKGHSPDRETSIPEGDFPPVTKF